MKITNKNVKDIFNYCPVSGVLSWKVRPRNHFNTDGSHKTFNSRFSNKEAGTTNNFACNKYYRILTFRSKNYLAHRVIWLFVFGRWPKHEIDHVDGDGLNNKIKNLRDVKHGVNTKNVKKGSRNTSGFVGVNFDKKRKSFRATICVEGKQIHIGRYISIEEAASARKAAEVKYGFHKNHGA